MWCLWQNTDCPADLWGQWVRLRLLRQSVRSGHSRLWDQQPTMRHRWGLSGLCRQSVRSGRWGRWGHSLRSVQWGQRLSGQWDLSGQPPTMQHQWGQWGQWGLCCPDCRWDQSALSDLRLSGLSGRWGQQPTMQRLLHLSDRSGQWGLSGQQPKMQHLSGRWARHFPVGQSHHWFR